MIEIVIINAGEPTSELGLRSHVRTLDLRVPTVTDDTPMAMTGPSWALFNRRERAVVVDLGTMQIVRYIDGTTGGGNRMATAMWQALDDVVRRQGGSPGGG